LGGRGFSTGTSRYFSLNLIIHS